MDAVNKTKQLDITFPTDHNEQKKIAERFSRKSKAGFDNCVGCIDGMLIWTHCPSQEDCNLCECGAKKFLCSRKKKFGLNMQAVCDDKGRFLDIEIQHPGATSDYLCFMTSQIQKKIRKHFSCILVLYSLVTVRMSPVSI